MITAARLFAVGLSSARRQRWAFVPLFVSLVLGRLLGLMPSITLAARFVRTGLAAGEVDYPTAYVLGFLTELDHLDRWLPAWFAGSLVAMVGAWLLGVVLQAGAVRLLASQASTTDLASEDGFAEGVLRAPATYLLTAALSDLLKFMMVGCALGALVSGMSFFTAHPGALAALLMTIATATILLLPLIVAALDVGFARAVILEESPSVALAEGLLLSWRRADALLPPWYLLQVLRGAFSLGGGFLMLIVSALSGDEGLWILRYGPASMVTLGLLAITTALEFVQLGVNATLVAEAAGTMPPPPEPVVAEPVLTAVAIGPDEPVLIAREIAPASEEPTNPQGET